MARSKKRAGSPLSLDAALYEAGGKKDAARVRLLLEAGADPSFVEGYGEPPLERAMDNEAGDVVDALLEGGASLWSMLHVGLRHDSVKLVRACIEAGSRPHGGHLAHAAQNDRREVLELLLGAGVDIEDAHRGTALTHACIGGHEELARLLIARGANVNARGEVPISRPGLTTHEVLTALEIAARTSPPLVTLLLASGVDRAQLSGALRWAAVEGRLECVEALAAAGTPLRAGALAAAREGQVEIVRALLDRVAMDGPEGSLLMAALRGAVIKPADAGRRMLVDEILARGPRLDVEDDGSTPLHRAAFLGHLALVERLLAAGASVHAKNGHGLTPLRYVQSYNDVAVLDRLIAAGADVDSPGDGGSTLLADLALHRSLVHVERLLAAGADPNGLGPNGERALHRACNVSPHASPIEVDAKVRIVEALLRAGADPSAPGVRGETPLSVAVRSGNAAIIAQLEAALPPVPEDPRALLARFGISFDAAGLSGAVRERNVTALRAFADARFDFASDAGYDALIWACEHERIDAARFLIEHGAPLKSERDNPLCRAANTGSAPLVKALLALGADPNGPSAGRMTPLAYAIEALSAPVVEALLAAGADPNEGGPLFRLLVGIRHAQEDGNLDYAWVKEILDALLGAGADLERRSGGATVLAGAVDCGFVPLVRMLVAAGADPDAKAEGGESPRERARGNVREALR